MYYPIYLIVLTYICYDVKIYGIILWDILHPTDENE